MKLGPCQPLLPYPCHCKPSSAIISGSSSSVRCLALAALTARLAGSSPSVGEPGLNESLTNQGAAETSSIFIAVRVRFCHSGASNHSIAPRSEPGCPWIVRLPFLSPSAASARPGRVDTRETWLFPVARPSKVAQPSLFAPHTGTNNLCPRLEPRRIQRSLDFCVLLRNHRVPLLVVCLAGCPRTTLELEVFVSRHPNS